MKLLTLHRQELGWSKAELARRSGLHPSQVGQIEAGRLVPYPVQLRRLAIALGVREDESSRLLEELPTDH